MSNTPETQPKARRSQRGTLMTSGRRSANPKMTKPSFTNPEMSTTATNQGGRSWASRWPSPWRTVSTSHGEPSAHDTLTKPKNPHHSIMAMTTARDRPFMSFSLLVENGSCVARLPTRACVPEAIKVCAGRCVRALPIMKHPQKPASGFSGQSQWRPAPQ